MPMSQDEVADNIPLQNLKSNKEGQRDLFIDVDANMNEEGPQSPGIGARFDF